MKEFFPGGDHRIISRISSRPVEKPDYRVRDSRESAKHREIIKEIASAYERAGYQVKAGHVKGFENPEACNVLKPDIRAEKGGEEVIVEVETQSSIGTRRDRMQREEFSEWAKKSVDRDFRREIVP